MAALTSTKPKVADFIDKLGVGPYLVKELFLGGGIWLAAGSQLIIVTAVTQTIAKEWGLEAWQRSSVVSVLFVGLIVGNIVSGPCSDLFGRRPPILISYAAVVVFSLGCAFAPGFAALCALRLLLGIAFGFAQPPWTSLCSEITPSMWRMETSVVSQLLFVVGEIYAASILYADDPTMTHLNWQALTLHGTVPAFVLGLACVFFLNESASWLAMQGHTEKASQILKSMRWWNGKEQLPVDFVVDSNADVSASGYDVACQQARVALGPVLRFTTVALCFSCIVLNFVYYGMLYAFPLVLGKVDLGVTPALAIIIGALWELPGYAVAIICSMLLGRRMSTFLYLVGMICSTMLFVEGAKQQTQASSHSAQNEYMLHAGFAGMKCFINVGFCTVYQYVSEIYPTNCRVAGTGICFGIGRLGSFSAPFVFEWLMEAYNDDWQLFFWLMSAICVVNGILVLFLPFETSGMILKDHVDELGEMEPLSQKMISSLYSKEATGAKETTNAA